ncbi:MAG: cyanophycinase [Roseivirga sp.]|nr:cyanophycinase [Roseivirga sp.]
MKKLSLLLCLLLIHLNTLAQGKLFIIGGGPRPANMINQMIDEADVRTNGYAVVLPMSSSNTEAAMASGKKQFVDNGIAAVTAFNFIKGDTPDPALLDSIRNAKLIYISGGSQGRFMNVVAGTAIEQAVWDCYQKGGTIAGTSAGAAVMSEKMITGAQVHYPDADGGFRVIEKGNTKLSQGLGLVKKAIIDQHFVRRSRHNRLITLAIENPGLKCIGIDESTAIIVKGNKVKVIGLSQVLVFDGSKGRKREKAKKISMKDLRLHIYLDGDTFSLN